MKLDGERDGESGWRRKARSVKLGIKATQLSGNEIVILDNVGKRFGTRIAVRGRDRR